MRFWESQSTTAPNAEATFLVSLNKYFGGFTSSLCSLLQDLDPLGARYGVQMGYEGVNGMARLEQKLKSDNKREPFGLRGHRHTQQIGVFIDLMSLTPPPSPIC